MTNGNSFQSFEEALKRDTEELKALEKDLSGKKRESEKKLTGVMAEIGKERGILAGLQVEYATIESTIETAAAEALITKGITAEKVKTGEATLQQFMEIGITEKGAREKAKAEVAEKLADALSLIREKKRKLYELEYQAAQERYNISYCEYANPKKRHEQMKYQTESLERAISNSVGGAFFAARAEFEKTTLDRDYSIGKGVQNSLQLENLTVDEVKALRFDPRFEKFETNIERIIAEMTPGQVCTLTLHWGTSGLALVDRISG